MSLDKRLRSYINKTSVGRFHKILEGSRKVKHNFIIMKRYGHLHEKIYELDNLYLADKNARKGKHSWGIYKHDGNQDSNLKALSKALKFCTFTTSDYSTFIIYEPKERLIYRLPYYPDRIAQWAIMNIMEPIWTKIFVGHSYSCIKGRGILGVSKHLRRDLKKDIRGTEWCLKLDIRKFYPSVKHPILKQIIRKKIKDDKLLNILDEIIDSTNGVPIGNYLSQFFANLYLTYFDHWLLEEIGVKYYYRYADDIVILSDDPNYLKKVLILIKLYLHHVLDLKVKDNYQVFRIEDRGIDFVGYKFYHTHTLLRKSIKTKIYALIRKYQQHKIDTPTFKSEMCAYFGWLKHCNSKNLLKKIEEKTGIHLSNWGGEEATISQFYNKTIRVIEIIDYLNYFQIHFVYKNKSYSVNSKDKILYTILKSKQYPLNFKLRKYVRAKKN